MRPMRALYAVLLAILVLAGVGCGSGEVGAGSGATPAAELKPGALAYVELVSDSGSAQWRQAEELLRRFPDGEKWITELRRKVAGGGVDWGQEVEPALGDTTAVAVYSAADGRQSPAVVALTNPEDPDKTLALVEKLDERSGGKPTATRIAGEWVVLSDDEAAIETALSTSGGSLAEDGDFKAAMETLPDDALARLYADPAAALDAFGSADMEAELALRLLGIGRLDFAGAWAKARDDGAETALTLGGAGAAGLLGAVEPYSSALLERVPADAFAFASFQGRAATQQLEELRDNPLLTMGLLQLEREVGIKLDDLVALLDGEVALYARPGLPIPELTLLLDSDDPTQARSSADKLLRLIAREEGAAVTEDGDVTTAAFDGYTVNFKTVEGTVVLSTSKRAFDELGQIGDKLRDSDRFKAALETAGVPNEYTGLTWVDVADAIELLQGYLETTGSPDKLSPEAARNLQALGSLVAWGTVDGDVAAGRAFLEID
jgi:Protein of unknown function (DUF3352)